jgi:hypothetical protein
MRHWYNMPLRPMLATLALALTCSLTASPAAGAASDPAAAPAMTATTDAAATPSAAATATANGLAAASATPSASDTAAASAAPSSTASAAPSPTASASPTATATSSTGAASASATAAAAPTPTGSEAGEPDIHRRLTDEELKKIPIYNRLNMDFAKGDKLLEDVKDRSAGYDESGFYYLIEKAIRRPDLLAKLDAEPVSFQALLDLPSSYRGPPITVQGNLMQVQDYAPPSLAIWKDVKVIYRCDVRAFGDIDTMEPYASIITLEDPRKVVQIGDPIQVKAYFYKILQYDYATGKGTGYGPLLVGRAMLPVTPPPVAGAHSNQWFLAVGFGLLAVLGGTMFTLRQILRSKQNVRNRPMHRFRIRRPGEPVPPKSGGSGGPSGGTKP